MGRANFNFISVRLRRGLTLPVNTRPQAIILVLTLVKQQVKRACMCMSISSRVISATSQIRAAEYDVFYRDCPSTDFRFGSWLCENGAARMPGRIPFLRPPVV